MDEAAISLSHRDELAATAVQLALTFPTWVRRRKWSYAYVDDTTVRLQQSVCFRMPDVSALPLAEGHRTILVPLWIAQKVPLTNVDVRDEDGGSLSLLSREENARTAARGLLWIFVGAALARDATQAIPGEELLAALLEITTAAPLPRGTPRHEVGARAAATVAPAEAIASALGVLRPDDERSALLVDLVDGFLVMVALDYEPGRDRVVKLAFDLPHRWHGSRREEPLDTRHSRARERGESALVALGLRDKVQYMPEIQIGWSLSTHVQLTAPPEVELGVAGLEVKQFDPVSRATVREAYVVYDKPTAELGVAVRPEWDFADPPAPRDENDPQDPAVVAHRNLMLCRGDVGTLFVRLAPSSRGAFLPAVVLSLLTAVFLGIASWRLADFDGPTSAAVMLALPAALAAYLARPGEHAFASRLLIGVRFAALTVGVCSLVVATLIAAGLTRREPLPRRAAFDDVACRTTTASRTRAHRPARTKLRCSGAIVLGAERAPARPWTQAVAIGCTVIASVLALLLSAGYGATFRRDLRRRGKPDELSAPGVAPA